MATCSPRLLDVVKRDVRERPDFLERREVFVCVCVCERERKRAEERDERNKNELKMFLSLPSIVAFCKK